MEGLCEKHKILDWTNKLFWYYFPFFGLPGVMVIIGGISLVITVLYHQWWLAGAFVLILGLIFWLIRVIFHDNLIKIRSSQKGAKPMTIFIVGCLGAFVGFPLAIGFYWIGSKQTEENTQAATPPGNSSSQPNAISSSVTLPPAVVAVEKQKDDPSSPQLDTSNSLDSTVVLMEEIRNTRLAQKNNDDQIKQRKLDLLKSYAPAFDYAIKTLTNKLIVMSLQSGDKVSSNYKDIPITLSNTDLASLKLDKNANWNFTITLQGAQDPLLLRIAFIDPQGYATPIMIVLTQDRNPATLSCSLSDFGGTPLWSNSCPIDNYQSTIAKLIDIMFAAQLDRLHKT